jgi:hypothetical protein
VFQEGKLYQVQKNQTKKAIPEVGLYTTIYKRTDASSKLRNPVE